MSPSANGIPLASPGDEGFVNWPDNTRLHATPARIVGVFPTGGGEHYYTAEVPAAGSGVVRLWPDEFRRPKAKPAAPKLDARQAKEAGYTGDVCQTCGSARMVRSGACAKCEECGATSGCS